MRSRSESMLAEVNRSFAHQIKICMWIPRNAWKRNRAPPKSFILKMQYGSFSFDLFKAALGDYGWAPQRDSNGQGAPISFGVEWFQ